MLTSFTYTAPAPTSLKPSFLQQEVDFDMPDFDAGSGTIVPGTPPNESIMVGLERPVEERD
jgi:hypothetical protein